MHTQQFQPFGLTPLTGNAIADITYYAVFLAAQIALTFRFLRKENWQIFFGILVFLLFEVLGSIAYLKLHYAPILGAWYTLWLFAWTAGPIFFISVLHFCACHLLRVADLEMADNRYCWSSSPIIRMVCLAFDSLALLSAAIGAVYIGAKGDTPATLQALTPGFDLLVVATVFEACSVVTTLFATINITILFARQRNRAEVRDLSVTKYPNIDLQNTGFSKKPKLLLIFLAGLIFTELLLLTFALIRAVDVAGGVTGPLAWPLLGGVETIILFIAILVFTVLHPVLLSRKTS